MAIPVFYSIGALSLSWKAGSDVSSVSGKEIHILSKCDW